jgi:hypothetical protein
MMEIENPKANSDVPLIGRRVELSGSYGTVKYSGPLQHEGDIKDPTAIWLGIQWDDAGRGKHNGTVSNFQYFTTDDGLNSGSLVKADKVNLGINIYDGILLRYFRQSDLHNEKMEIEGASKENEVQNSKGESIEFDEEAYFETAKKFKKKVEFIGFNKVWKKINDLKNIKELSVPDLIISNLGPEDTLKNIIPSVRNLSLERNLIFDWNQIYQMGREIAHLEQISVSGNRLMEPEDVRTLDRIYIVASDTYVMQKPINVFQNLKTLILINMNLTWKTVNKVIPAFNNIEELILCKNKCNDFENLILEPHTLQGMTFLNLEDNQIKSFKGLMMFKDLPKLEKLTLNKNSVTSIPNPEGFAHVKLIIMEENGINNFKILSELNQFPLLESIRITNNPIYQAFSPLHIRQRAIAEIKGLKIMNGSLLGKYERKDCEIYYMKKSFEDYFTISKENQYDYDFAAFMKYVLEDHPRVPELIKKFGNPYEITEKMREEAKAEALAKAQAEASGLMMGEVPIKSKNAYATFKSNSTFLSLKLNALSGAFLGKPPVTKKFSDNTLVVNLKSLLAKQFSMSSEKIRIFFKPHPSDPFTQLEDDLKDLYFYGVKYGSEIWVDDS